MPISSVSYCCKAITFLLPSSGFVVPKGWRIYVFVREHNYDPFLYPEPFKFNPWRWMVRKHDEVLSVSIHREIISSTVPFLHLNTGSKLGVEPVLHAVWRWWQAMPRQRIRNSRDSNISPPLRHQVQVLPASSSSSSSSFSMNACASWKEALQNISCNHSQHDSASCKVFRNRSTSLCVVFLMQMGRSWKAEAIEVSES